MVEQEQQRDIQRKLLDGGESERDFALPYRLHEVYHVEAQEHKRRCEALRLQERRTETDSVGVRDESADDVGGKHAVEHHAEE